MLKLVAETLDDLERVVDAVQHAAQHERVRRVALRCQSAFADAYLRLVERGFRVHWTDLRMILRGHALAGPALGSGVVQLGDLNAGEKVELASEK